MNPLKLINNARMNPVIKYSSGIDTQYTIVKPSIQNSDNNSMSARRIKNEYNINNTDNKPLNKHLRSLSE